MRYAPKLLYWVRPLWCGLIYTSCSHAVFTFCLQFPLAWLRPVPLPTFSVSNPPASVSFPLHFASSLWHGVSRYRRVPGRTGAALRVADTDRVAARGAEAKARDIPLAICFSFFGEARLGLLFFWFCSCSLPNHRFCHAMYHAWSCVPGRRRGGTWQRQYIQCTVLVFGRLKRRERKEKARGRRMGAGTEGRDRRVGWLFREAVAGPVSVCVSVRLSACPM